jgi:Mg-chelatase subunit ChlD
MATTKQLDNLRGEFARQLQRAAVKRGGLEEFFKGLSDHWTLTLQRLYPVWVVCGPGLADPGHIEIHSRTVYLDSEELLGPKDELLAGRIDAYRVLVCFGVAIHETLHARHTKRWVLEHDAVLADSGQETLLEDRRLLEEPRMEAHGMRAFPPRSARAGFARRALAACVTEVILPRFIEQIMPSALAGQPVTRDICGRAMTYLHARTHYGVVDPASLGALEPIWRAVLGETDMRALDELYARLIWAPDGENTALDRLAGEYREIIGQPEPQTGQGAGGSGEQGGAGGDKDADPSDPDSEGGGPGRAGEGAGEAGQASAKSLREALTDAQGAERAAQLQQLNEDVSLQELLAGATAEARAQQGGRATGAPSGRMPDRGVDRAAYPDEAQAAVRFANKLRRARTEATRRIDKRTPGGKFQARNYVRGRAQRQAGQPVTSHPWSLQQQIRNPIEDPHVGIVLDTSGSMAQWEGVLGAVVWIIDRAIRSVDGKVAIALFGNGMQLLSDGSAPLRQVPGIRVGGGTAFGGDAIVAVTEHLEITNPRRPRLLFCISDGGWYDTHAGVQKIRWLAEQDVPTIHISIGAEPLSVEADRISVISDPADALDIVAADTVAAISGRGRARR